MPQSFSLSFHNLLSKPSTTTPPYQTLLANSELNKVFQDSIGDTELAKILEGERVATTTCGSGMSAAIVWLALQELGAKRVALYDEVSV